MATIYSFGSFRLDDESEESNEFALGLGRVKNDPKRRHHALHCLAEPRYASFMTSTADGN